ncbi:hypothetical protein HIM_11193 [Hirsutella minnesotensis 3608]|uniref:Uncharacterized protein n=1 Tax=Hirsutella minnesotensis 3608 TaxID=1043627 RepID=A0A0F7ZJ92_9HYPO|nr:hypothetical protein HIM_11193 [Hirsutella minnesotensis 3608]
MDRKPVCYCVRAFALGRRAAAKQHKARFSLEQWTALEVLVEQLDLVAAAVEKGLIAEEEACNGADGEGDEDLTALDGAVFRFFTCSLMQKLPGDYYENPLLHFAAVLGVARDGEAWIPAHSHTRFLAGFLWCGRVLMLEYFFRDDTYGTGGGGSGSESGGDDEPTGDDADRGGDDEYYEGTDRRDARFAAICGFQEGHREWLVGGTYTPFSAIVRWMTFGRVYRQNEGGQARVAWSQDGKTLRYEGDDITVAGFQQMAHAIAAETESWMDKLVGGKWGEVRRAIELRKIADRMSMFSSTWSIEAHSICCSKVAWWKGWRNSCVILSTCQSSCVKVSSASSLWNWLRNMDKAPSCARQRRGV